MRIGVVAMMAAISARLTRYLWDTHGNTPLHNAVQTGDTVAIAALLILAEADPNARNKNGQILLHFAALSGHAAAIMALLEAGAGRPGPGNHAIRSACRQMRAGPVGRLRVQAGRRRGDAARTDASARRLRPGARQRIVALHASPGQDTGR